MCPGDLESTFFRFTGAVYRSFSSCKPVNLLRFFVLKRVHFCRNQRAFFKYSNLKHIFIRFEIKN